MKLGIGEPRNKRGRCNARCFIGDNFGDNHVTFVCQLRPGHSGLHIETWCAPSGQIITITWLKGEEKA